MYLQMKYLIGIFNEDLTLSKVQELIYHKLKQTSKQTNKYFYLI